MRSKGSSAEVEFSVDGCMGGKDRFCGGILEQVESDDILGDEVTPFLGGKV